MYKRSGEDGCSARNLTVYRIDLYANGDAARNVVGLLEDSFADRTRSSKAVTYVDTPVTSAFLSVTGWKPVDDLRLMGRTVRTVLGSAQYMFPGVQHVHIGVEHPAIGIPDRLSAMALLDGNDGELIKWLLGRGGNGTSICHRGHPFYRKNEKQVSAPYLLSRPKWLRTTLLENYSYLESKAIADHMSLTDAERFTKTFVNLAYQSE